MSENSKIEWTDHTFNPWIGCTKVSPGCANCYAETLMDTRYGRVKWGKGNPRQRTSDENWKLPLKWNKHAIVDSVTPVSVFCPGDGELIKTRRPRVFCASLADWLDNEVPIEWLASLLDLIRQTPNLDWLLLTKRPENFARVEEAGRRLESDSNWDKLAKDHPAVALHAWIGDWTVLRKPPENVWIGTTVEDQQRADERIPALLRIPAKARFLSCEPLLGPVDLKFAHDAETLDCIKGGFPVFGPIPTERIHWVICGGESGKDARPMHPEWARSLWTQCARAGVPFFFKQWGTWQPAAMGTAYMDKSVKCQMVSNGPGATGWPVYRVGKSAAGRILDGREHNEFPEVQS